MASTPTRKSDNEQKCKLCGGDFVGVPWRTRVCSTPDCGGWMPPIYSHPDAPEEVKQQGRLKMKRIAQLLIEGVA